MIKVIIHFVGAFNKNIMLFVGGGLSFVFGQVAFAVESNATLAAHGRQINIAQSPVIEGTGNIGGTLKLSSLPSAIDLDGDPLVGWYYSWLVGGASVTTETLIGKNGTITPYIPALENVGKTAVLRLKAIADSHSFPESTRISVGILSNAISIITPPPPPPDTTVLTSGWVGHDTRNGTFNIDGESVTVTTQSQSDIGIVPVRNTWVQSTSCGQPEYIGAVSADIYTASTLSLKFSRPITNIQFTTGYMDLGDVVTITTNAISTPRLNLFHNAGCTQPNVVNNTVSGNGYNYGHIVNIGGAYFTELKISTPGGWIHMHYNYSHGKVVK